MVELGAVTTNLRNTYSYTYTPLGTPADIGGWTPATWSDTTPRGHKRKLSASSFLTARRQRWTWCAVAGATLLALWVLFSHKAQIISSDTTDEPAEDEYYDRPDSEQLVIEIEKSIEWNGREVFLWEQFRKFKNYYSSWQNIVPYNEYTQSREEMLLR